MAYALAASARATGRADLMDLALAGVADVVSPESSGNSSASHASSSAAILATPSPGLTIPRSPARRIAQVPAQGSGQDCHIGNQVRI